MPKTAEKHQELLFEALFAEKPNLNGDKDFNRYIEEAEHQDGKSFWFNFSDHKELAWDYNMWYTFDNSKRMINEEVC